MKTPDGKEVKIHPDMEKDLEGMTQDERNEIGNDLVEIFSKPMDEILAMSEPLDMEELKEEPEVYNLIQVRVAEIEHKETFNIILANIGHLTNEQNPFTAKIMEIFEGKEIKVDEKEVVVLSTSLEDGLVMGECKLR